MASDYFAGGEWNFRCDVCFHKTKSSQAKKRWDGAITCGRGSCWEPRHPQDFVRAREDDQSVGFSRPDQDIFLENNPLVTTTSIVVPPTSGSVGATVVLSRVNPDTLIGSL